MRLKNNSASVYDFSYEGEDRKMKVFSVKPNEEIEINKKHPLFEQMSKLPKEHPKDWIELAPPKLSKEELESQLADRKAEEKAEADAKKLAAAEAKKNGKPEEKSEGDDKQPQ